MTLIAAALLLAFGSSAHAQSTEEDELALSYGDTALVSIATGSEQPLARVPAVASVITARDIAAMGATDLDQVLESVPGVHVSVWSAPLNPLYQFRGIVNAYNSQVLVLVNGVPITSAFLGNRGQAWGGMPLENVARIEIIRGPGSALYGADAFSGVINVITKNASAAAGVEVGVRAGSFRNRDAWVQYGGAIGPVQAALYLRAGSTDRQEGLIERDVQSILDGLFGSNASRAPGRMNARREAVDARADFSYGNWRLRLGAQDRKSGIALGLADALDPEGVVPETRVYGDLSYNQENWLPNWDLSASASMHDMRNRVASPGYKLFPDGAFGGAYPNGVIGNPGHSERSTALSVTGVYTGLAAHRVRVGTGYHLEDMYATAEFKNFNFVVIPGVGPALLPLPGLVDARTDPTLLFMVPHKRNVKYLFAQDEWKVAKDWTLTAGVRYDRYSDFGGTTNPRLALVWDASYNLIIKALHGRAFRAPNFTEQHTRNNPVNVGNPNIQPETMAMNELAFVWQPLPAVQTNLSMFRYQMERIIIAAPNADPSTGKTFQNTGGQHGHGFELEARWDASRDLRLSGHLSVQNSTDEASGQDAGLAPQQRLFGRADWQFASQWQLGAIVNHVADRARQPGDARPKIADYTTLDFSLRRQKAFGNWDLRATVLNALDRDAREPSFAPGNIPFDIPLPRRAINIELSYKM
ncbi:MAG: TonB-dependent receptor [Pseudomonadota bacterium]